MPRHPSRKALARQAIIYSAILLLVSGLLVDALGVAQASPRVVLGAGRTPGRTSSPNGLLINEVYDSQSFANEYFELYNTGSASIDLSTYRIYNSNGSTPLSLLDNPVIGPGQFRAIGPSQLHTSTIGSGLGRTDFLGLINSSPSDVVIDVVNWGNSPNPSWANYSRFSGYFFTSDIPQMPTEDGPKSLQRWPDGKDTDVGTDWASIFSSPGAPSCADPYEDDDTFASANAQGNNALHRMCPTNDEDWTTITMSTNYTYTITAAAYDPRANMITPTIRLYDASNILVFDTNNTTSNTATFSFRPSAAQTYRAQVVDAHGQGAAGFAYLYNFTVAQQLASTPTPSTSSTPTAIGCQDQYEPDNSGDTAHPIDLNTEQVHTLCLNNGQADQDWVVFSAVGGKVYSMYTKDLAAPVDTIITLYDDAGHKLAENDDYAPGQGLYSRIDYTFGSTGVYYLRIRDKRGASGPGYQYTVGVSSTGALPPTSTPSSTPTFNPNTPTPTTGPCEDSFEPDGVPETAKVILIGTTQHRSFCPAGDADWVRFFARAGKVYTIRTGNLGVGVDTFMFLFDSDASTIIAQNDDGGDGVASRIDFYPQRDAWYFAQIKNAGDIGGTDQIYDLSLAVVPGVPQPPSTATSIIAPVVTVTNPPIPPTQPQAPTPPPVNTPTQGPIQPTPALVATQPPPPVATGAPQAIATATSVPQLPPTDLTPTPAPSSAVPGVPGTGNEQTGTLPGVPNTGFDPTGKKANDNGTSGSAPAVVVGSQPSGPVSPPKPAADANYAPITFRLFYDANHNDRFEVGEGIKGINVFFLGGSASNTLEGKLVTADGGAGDTRVPVGAMRVYIPYLDINMALTRFPERELHSLWLPPVNLPSRVP